MTEGERLARQFGCKFIETSAKSRKNVENSFYDIVREIRRFNRDMSSGAPHQANGSGQSPTEKMHMGDERESKGCGCCTVM